MGRAWCVVYSGVGLVRLPVAFETTQPLLLLPPGEEALAPLALAEHPIMGYSVVCDVWCSVCRVGGPC